MKTIKMYILILSLLISAFFYGCIDINNNIENFNIQVAIDNANSGDTIYVKSGIFNEILTINKSIKLIGEGENKSIIDCKLKGKSDSLNIITLNADNCTIIGFKIINSEVSSDVIGIYINSSNNTILKNTVSIVNHGIFLND